LRPSVPWCPSIAAGAAVIGNKLSITGSPDINITFTDGRHARELPVQEEKLRLRLEGFAEKESFKPGMKE